MKLHIVVRADLSTAQQAVQSVHAMREFSEQHPEEDRVWYQKSNTLALLAAEDEKALEQLLAKARERCIPYSEFREPDRGNELTAAAIGPTGKRICRGLPLAFAEGGLCALINAHKPPPQEHPPT